MLTLNFGFEKYMALSITQTWTLLLILVISAIWLAYRKQRPLFQHIIRHFKVIWYSFITIILTIITIYHFDDISYQKPNFATIAASALIIILILPLFKRISAFGVEAELANFNAEKEVIESQARLEATEKIMREEDNSDSKNPEKIAMQNKLQLIKEGSKEK